MKQALVFSTLVLTTALAQSSLARDRGAVFVMTNSAHHNEILSFAVESNGSLKAAGTFATDGRGSGGTTDPLGSQGSLTLSEDHSLLFAVNAGSGTLSSFRVNGTHLELVDAKPTGGAAPVAVAEHGGLVYVVNFAGASDVVGFKVDDGWLIPISGSERYLTTGNSGASSLAFSGDGKFLVVTEKLTNKIDVFPVNADGTLGTIATTIDPAAGLFDVVIAPDNAVLALEATAGSMTPFMINADGTLTALSAPVPTLGAASCWNVVTPDGHFAYTANAGSGTISGFAISGAGILSPIGSTVVATLPSGSADIDIAVSGDSKYLYSLDAGTGTIGIMAIHSDGTLKLIGTMPALPASSGQQGIAAL